jgi:hypothetical protein
MNSGVSIAGDRPIAVNSRWMLKDCDTLCVWWSALKAQLSVRINPHTCHSLVCSCGGECFADPHLFAPTPVSPVRGYRTDGARIVGSSLPHDTSVTCRCRLKGLVSRPGASVLSEVFFKDFIASCNENNCGFLRRPLKVDWK